MTAIAKRRSRRTIVGAVTAVVLTAAASAMFVVGVVTLSNSQEGEAVGVDTRPREVFPATPNALLAVTDDAGQLASVAVLTLLPSGVGGSIVTIPVNADSTAGFGVQRRPLNELFDVDRPSDFTVAVEDMLSITIERTAVVDPASLAALLAPVGEIQVVLPDAVVDSDDVDLSDEVEEGDPPQGVVITAGPQRLSTDDIVVVFTSIDESVAADAQHAIDVAMWSAIAEATPISGSTTTSDAGPPATVEDLVVQLFSGDVAVRDLSYSSPSAANNVTDADVVVLDRADANLVFAQISPALVSTPNPGLKVRIESNYTDEQIAQSRGLFESSSDVARGFTSQMLLLQNNVVSADTMPAGAPEVTIVLVSDPRRLAETEAAAEALFGQAEVSVAEVVLEGVDLEVTLGMTYLIREMVRVEAADDGMATDTVPSTGSSVPSTAGTVVDDG